MTAMTSWGRYCRWVTIICRPRLLFALSLLAATMSSSSSSTPLTPRILVRSTLTLRLSLPCCSRLLGVSGRKSAPRVSNPPGTAATASETRHPQPCLIFCVKKLVRRAVTAPMPTQSWKPLLNAPRCSGGAISDRYRGTACVYPSPTPSSTLPKITMETFTAVPPIAEPARIALPAMTIDGRRPHLAVTDEARKVVRRPAM
ncbi:hypothetical protein EE612_047703 [Oryza sativa]|nr:hypothetical protein EE612_047703 [Oryza sativa]